MNWQQELLHQAEPPPPQPPHVQAPQLQPAKVPSASSNFLLSPLCSQTPNPIP